jgi:predicted nuclease with TOPRIM domain
LDKDGNGQIDKDEMLDFLAKNGVDEDHRVQIVDELFNKCDADGNGYVDIGEFVNEYIDTKNQLVKREQDLKENIERLDQRLKKMQADNKAARSKPNYNNSGPVGALEIKLSAVMGLQPGVQFAARITYDMQNTVTATKPGPEMVMDHKANFTITDETKPVVIEIEQVSNQYRDVIWRHYLQFEPDICGVNDSK